MLSPTENRRIQGLFRHLSDLPVLFKAYLIFKDFSRKLSKFKYFSSLCQPWTHPKLIVSKPDGRIHLYTKRFIFRVSMYGMIFFIRFYNSSFFMFYRCNIVSVSEMYLPAAT